MAEDDDPPTDVIFNPQRLIVRETELAGRGVFAPQEIPAGTVLEEAPVLVLAKEEWETGKLNDGVLGSYAFNWSNGGMAVGLGIGENDSGHSLLPGSSIPCAACMFNHSSSPNVNYTRLMPSKTSPNQRPCLKFTAFRTIKAGEELFISYSADASKLWFDQGEPSSRAVDDSESDSDPLPMGETDEPDAQQKKAKAVAKEAKQREKALRKLQHSKSKDTEVRRLDDDYEAALEKLGLAKPLEISAEAVAAEKQAMEADPGRWKLVQRIRGPVEDDDEG